MTKGRLEAFSDAIIAIIMTIMVLEFKVPHEPTLEALCKLATDPQLRNRLGETGRARFTDQFRHQNMTKQIRDVYAAVLNKYPGQST